MDITVIVLVGLMLVGLVSYAIWASRRSLPTNRQLSPPPSFVRPEDYPDTFVDVPRTQAVNPQATQVRKDIPSLELICIKGSPDGAVHEGQRFRFKDPWLIIGRAPESNVVILGTLVSRKHAALYMEQGSLLLQDLDSTNGTWLNGQRISKTPIRLREPFDVGPCQFVVVSSGEQISVSHAISHPPPTKTVVTDAVAREVAVHSELQLLRELGEGGAAAVYLCRNAHGREIALKILHQTADPYFKTKFKDEIQAGQSLIHENIVRILSSSQATAYPYITMEYMNGGSLRDYLLAKRVLPENEAIHIIGQICLGLGYAHQRRIYHRDMKPENILFNHVGVFKVADFGIAKLTQSSAVTQQGAIIGTPHYMSHEQAKANEVDGRSDQYSVAIILFEMLTGRPPFDGEGLTVVEHHILTPPPSPRMFNAKISSRTEKAILRALEKNRDKRFKDMFEFAKALGYAVPDHTTPTGFLPARLIALAESPTQEIVALRQPYTDIGRDTLQINLPHISRQHARIHYHQGQYIIEDLGSSNGTFVNNLPIQGHQSLYHKDVIRIGPISFRFVMD